MSSVLSISVVIPTYNSCRTIRKCLYSVFNQTISVDEVIIIDDGSIDSTVEKVINIFKEFKNNTTITCKIFKQENSGPAKARNLGILNASSKWIAFLDSDDFWHKDKILIINKYLKSEKYELIGHDSFLKNNNINEIDIKTSDIKVREISFFQNLLKNRFVTPSIIIQNNNWFFDETMRFTEDHEMWQRILFKKKGLFIEANLVGLNRPVLSKGGLSSNVWAMRKGELLMYFKITKYFKSFYIFIPFFILFSMIKHIFNTLKRM